MKRRESIIIIKYRTYGLYFNKNIMGAIGPPKEINTIVERAGKLFV